MKQKRIYVWASAVSATAILLLLILWLSPTPEPDLGPVSATDNSETLHPVAEAVIFRRFESPDEWYAAGTKGESYAGALTGDGWRVDSATGALLGQSPPQGPYLPDYAIGRAYVGWDTSALPDDAEVLSATLVLEVSVGSGRTKDFSVVAYRGDWTPPIDLDDWNSSGSQVVGRWHLPASRVDDREILRTGEGVTLYTLQPPQKVRVSLDPAVVETGAITRLELRHASEGTTPISAELVPLDASQIRLEVEYRP